MIRILVFMGLMAMSMLIASCCRIIIIPICHCGTVVVPLYQSIRESLQMVKKEFTSTIILTTEKVNCNEVDLHVGNEIIDGLRETMKQIDTLIAESVQLGKTGTKEETLFFAERSNLFIMRAQTNLKSLRDLYDISAIRKKY
jgi:hypothetical protein